MPSSANKLGGPLVLIILDGFGEREHKPDNAITNAKAPRWTELRAKYPITTIGTSGPDVGLPPGQMGNSEVGHLNFGAGRIAQMDISRIDCEVADGTLMKNPEIARVVATAKAKGGRLHLLGLVSDGGVHSSIEHLFALIDGAEREGVRVVLHAFLDGRDTPPKSGGGYLARTMAHLGDRGVVGTIAGRYFAMDRDKRWDRVEKAFKAIVAGRGHGPFPDAQHAIENAYEKGQNDEFVEPRIIAGYEGVRPGDAALFFNFRPDRAREMSEALTSLEFAHFDRAAAVGQTSFAPPFAYYVCMTQYEERLGLPVAFPKPTYEQTFPEIIARAGFRQLRCAETEKYAHVTYFFNGGVEKPFEGEDRILIPSPKEVATYDQKPEMSAPGVTEAVVKAIGEKDYDFVLVNFANPDMVGHTGVLPAAIHAVEVVDEGVGRIVDAVLARGGAVLITADHGNCEQMIDEKTGAPFTQHTINRVPFLFVREGGESTKLREGGRIADVAPTMLKLVGLPQPKEMTGESLV
ncbi:MAG: 2,3-bisphosphoglycerate-independent phosphoglycerate mutase [Deltaproteobacteria bacterium]|nr:2,3-bisphosphoglycerate-independent phosphoglycerate mutase [Deltaproteobacteria bacterium]